MTTSDIPAGEANAAIEAGAAFGRLLRTMTDAICRGDGEAAARCFTDDGVYDDGFYGEFAGRAAIARMVREHFHRDARDFRWEVIDPVADGRRGYARYAFSYVSRIPGSEGRPADFAGVSVCRLRDGLIERYEELFDRGPVLIKLGFPDARVLAHLRKRAGAGSGHGGA